ncbi:unnamed protein product [Soboliphyme baturini]|uniref:MFS domain-containing protein n=1 Tax=Soboliphyme baturini TaxID=241478 RepID=A0A183J6K6_9BILA|nr:unnamed protein product [Soboliphyme baturini]
MTLVASSMPFSQEDICENVTNMTLRIEIEAVSSRYMQYSQLIGCFLALILSFFIGPWADTHGRKVPLLICLVGYTFGQFVLVIAAGFPTLPPAFLLLSSFISGITGHALAVIGLFFTIVTDNASSLKWLTVRIGVTSGVLSFGYLTGNLLTSYLLPLFSGYDYMAVISTGFCALAVLHVALFLRETLLKQSPTLIEEEEAETHDVRFATMRRVFGLFRVREYFSTLCRFRSQDRRFYLHMSLLMFFIVFTCDPGLPGLQVLFVKLPPLSFTDSLYAISLACQTASMAIGIMLFPYLFKLLDCRDTLMIVIGIGASATKMLLFAVSTNRAMVYTCNVAFR